MEEAEDDEARWGMGFEVCERVSPRARACTPLMAPSGYSRRTLSYLLFNARDARRKREEKARNRQKKEGTEKRRGIGTTIYPQTSHTSRSTEFRRIWFREWKSREINIDTTGLVTKQREDRDMHCCSSLSIFKSQIHINRDLIRGCYVK